MKCGLGRCGADAVEIVAHPFRAEARTPVCDYHAGNVHQAVNIDAEVVVADV